MACFCMSHKLRMIFTSLKRCRKKGRRRNATETTSGLQSLKYLLSGPSQKNFANLWLKTTIYLAHYSLCWWFDLGSVGQFCWSWLISFMCLLVGHLKLSDLVCSLLKVWQLAVSQLGWLGHSLSLFSRQIRACSQDGSCSNNSKQRQAPIQVLLRASLQHVW